MTTLKNFEHHPDDLRCEIIDGILVLTINRQDRYNAWTSALRDDLATRLNEANANSEILGAVLTGAGNKAFCSGQELSELESFSSGENIVAWLGRLTDCYDAVRAFSKPLVAAVNGVAAGSGFQVTQFCDYVVAHPGVKMGQTEVSSGLPSVFGTWLMWERVGRRAIELALQGRLMQAEEARNFGFVQELVEPGEVLNASLRAARRLANQPTVAFRLSKKANREFDQQRYEKAMQMAGVYYREAFNTGAPQAAIVRFFDQRAMQHQKSGHQAA
jgi:enoyl-CoA hydratase